jgi:hypothetical protein
MQGLALRVTAILFFALAWSRALAESEAENLEVRISIADQKLVLLRDGMWLGRFDVSTSKFGVGDAFGSYKTPLGRLKVCSKIGDGLPVGSVMNHRNATGEILPANSRGRDPIVTRIMWLEGLEACNEHARSRGIYIHGTVEEQKIGKPVSYGCIRMRSRDVVDLFEVLPVGTPVSIQQDKLPRFKRWSPPPPMPVIAAKEPVKPKAPEKVEKTKEPVLVASHTTEKVEKVEKISPKTEPVVVKHAVEKPEKLVAKTEPVVIRQKEPVVIAQHVPARTETEPVAMTPTRMVIKASGAEDHDVRPSDFANAAFKSSILFADLPGHGPQQRKN